MKLREEAIVMVTLRQYLRDKLSEMSQAEMARRIGVDQTYVRRWLTGVQPTTELCARIALAFGLAEDDVLAMAGHRKVSERAPDDPVKAAAVAEAKRIIESTPSENLRVLMQMWKSIASLPGFGITGPSNTLDANKIYQAV